MPMDAGAIGIRPITQQRPTGSPEGVQRREDGSSSGSGFRPQTNVALKTAIEDLAGTLSKISAHEKFGIERMPKEVGQIVKNILQQSFSMDATLSQGIGSTIESQRFSMEQLSVFARMLSQIGALADKGFSMELSDQTQTLLTNFKNLLVSQEGGNALEPVLMSKAAFELIDAKDAEQLPQALYEILAQLTQNTTMPVNQPQSSESMQFLKQLVQYFMPRPSSSESSTQGQTQQGQQGQQTQQQQQSPTQQFLQSMFRQLGDKIRPQTQPQTSQSQTQNNSPQAQSQTSQSQTQNNSPQTQQFSDEFLEKQMEMREQMQTAKTTLLRQPMQNNSQTMDAMKNLAQMLMRNAEMSPRETLMLQNFVNNTQTMFSEGEARHLQNLLRLCQQNVPMTVQQAAVQQNLPDLPRLWAFMQLCDMAGLTSRMTAKAFKRAGRDVAEFANGMRQAMGGENSNVQSQRSFQMMMPLYLGEDETSYPTYLSVYDENERDKETGIDKKETWVRICVLTDNIGAAELTFRIYEENRLDMRFYFSHRSVANEFRNYIDDITNSLKDSSLDIGEIRIGSVGDKMRLP